MMNLEDKIAAAEWLAERLGKMDPDDRANYSDRLLAEEVSESLGHEEWIHSEAIHDLMYIIRSLKGSRVEKPGMSIIDDVLADFRRKHTSN